MYFEPGDLLNERYRIDRALSLGGRGNVYLVTSIADNNSHLPLNQQAVLKVADLCGRGSKAFKLSVEAPTIKKWASIVKSLYLTKTTHANVVSFREFGRADEWNPYFISDFVEGVSLKQLIKNQGPLNLAQTIEIMGQVCDGLEYVYSLGAKWWDVRPTTVMVNDISRNKPQVKLLDCGQTSLFVPEGSILVIAGLDEALERTTYFSPEQSAYGILDKRTDVFSLGCLLKYCLYGPGLVDQCKVAKPAAPKASAVPKTIEEIIRTCCSVNPEKRYQSAGELATALRHYKTDYVGKFFESAQALFAR